MTVETILEQLKANQHASVIKRYETSGERQAYIGVMMGTISKLAKTYAKQHDLALPLWKTGILEAQLLAIPLFDMTSLTEADIEDLIDVSLSLLVLDKLVDKVVSQHPAHQILQVKWLALDDEVYQRLAWRIAIKRASRKGLTHSEIDDIMAHTTQTLPTSPEVIRWVMNHCLVEIAVRYPTYREPIIQLTRQLGVYRDMVVAKGCTSAYAPDWIAARLN